MALLVGCKNNSSQQEPVSLDENIEYPEYVEQTTEAPAEQEEEEWDDVIHIRYDKPVKVYTVTVDLSGDYAEMHFVKCAADFTAVIDMFDEQLLYEEGVGEFNGKETVLPYVPLVFGKKISSNGTFGFFDIDYDGQDELIYAGHGQESRGSTAFRVFELDGTEREDEPFYAIDDMTEFNASALTDSTHVDYKVDFTDSVRVHCRKQGDKMVLVKRECL